MTEMQLMSLSADVVAAARVLADMGLNRGTAGNVSARGGRGMLITPSGIAPDALGPAQIVSMALYGSWDGALTPSSEWRLHADIYARYPGAGAVVHTHSDHATALATLGEPIPAFHYMVAVAGGDHIACADYATFGTPELSQNMLRALGDRRACLLAHHGMICHERDLPTALALAQEVEGLARQFILARCIGRPAVLPRDEMQRVLERFRTGYGQGDDASE